MIAGYPMEDKVVGLDARCIGEVWPGWSRSGSEASGITMASMRSGILPALEGLSLVMCRPIRIRSLFAAGFRSMACPPRYPRFITARPRRIATLYGIAGRGCWNFLQQTQSS